MFGPGIAYRTSHPDHTLNVPAHLMGGIDEEDGDGFVHWLARQPDARLDARDFEQLRCDYPARRHYGDYLRMLLDVAMREHPARAQLVPAEALRIEWRGAGYRVHLGSGTPFDADQVVLCHGNLLPPPLSPASDPNIIEDPWRSVTAIPPNAHVVLVGTGLTMVDTVLELASAGFRGRLSAVSRHGLLPAEDVQGAAYPDFFDPAIAKRGILAVSRRLRAEVRAATARGVAWQWVVDAFRVHAGAIWRALDDRNRRRFLRHVRSLWLVHRHRLPARQMRRIEALRPVVHRARVLAVDRDTAGLHLWIQRPGAQAHERFAADRVINCTGPAGDYTRADMPLIRALFADGLARPDRYRLGLDVDTDLRVIDADGQPGRGLFAIGAPTRATFWEITAVPQFRRQIEALVKMIARTSPTERIQ